MSRFIRKGISEKDNAKLMKLCIEYGIRFSSVAQPGNKFDFIVYSIAEKAFKELEKNG